MLNPWLALPSLFFITNNPWLLSYNFMVLWYYIPSCFISFDRIHGDGYCENGFGVSRSWNRIRNELVEVEEESNRSDLLTKKIPNPPLKTLFHPIHSHPSNRMVRWDLFKNFLLEAILIHCFHFFIHKSHLFLSHSLGWSERDKWSSACQKKMQS